MAYRIQVGSDPKNPFRSDPPSLMGNQLVDYGNMNVLVHARLTDSNPSAYERLEALFGRCTRRIKEKAHSKNLYLCNGTLETVQIARFREYTVRFSGDYELRTMIRYDTNGETVPALDEQAKNQLVKFGQEPVYSVQYRFERAYREAKEHLVNKSITWLCKAEVHNESFEYLGRIDEKEQIWENVECVVLKFSM
ncbi:hypothetical protein L596_017749 [Steinernema carpocapsae]|uniref:Uncharacterized protein n=1 Tax=Steinernema carpocapsae TaxID=34508 RepID=A0A4U5N2K4_STECR|nr:hypothetical protein L596_017749 [Steinernema carpocapsae]